MTYAMPVPLPSALVEHHAIDLERKYTDGWGMTVKDVASAPSGETYVLSGIYRSFGRDKSESDAGKVSFGYTLLSRYSPDGTVLATAISGQSDFLRQDTTFGGPTTGLSEDLWWAEGLCVLPDGALAATGSGDHTHLITSDLTAVTAHHGMPHRSYDDGPRDPFASSISTTPAGRLLCTTGEYGVYNAANLLDNIVSVTDQPLTPTAKPTLRALVSMEAAPVKQTEADLRPDLLHQGEPVGMDHRPRPSLTEHLTALEATAHQGDWHRARLGRPAVVREDLYVVPVYGHTYRGGSRGQRFAFVLVDDQGTIVGELGGMHLWRDSPFTGFCFEIAADAERERIYHLNRYGLFAWTANGIRAQRLDLDDKRYKLLKHFTLLECTPEGELILAHRTQHLLLRIPCPTMLGDLGQVVEDAVRSYARERTALKKQWQPASWHWVESEAPVHRL
ncbi:hypothetical protein AB0J38_27770 [Streptomyces sp. NPDC050095]|uniref:hypothetical protein n=1 Tax=unclassified Streptomyces TaxID=2593676 RepID=UPI00343046A1